MRKKEFRKSIEDFNSALEQGHAAVYRRNFDSDAYEYMGEYIKEITGYGPEELTPEIWDSLIISAEAKDELAGLSLEECYRLNRTGKVDRWQADMQIQTRSGQTRWVTDMSTVLREESGNCFGSLGILQDITDRKEAEKQLVELTEKLRLRTQQTEADLSMAREVQQALVTKQPKQFPLNAVGGQAQLNFYHRYIPAEMLGGDFFDILPLSESEVGVFIFDVVGHGVRAALLTTFLRGLIEELRPQAGDPGTLLGRINHSLITVFGESDSLLFATACYLVFDATTGMIRFSNAGHSPPLCLQPENRVVAKLETPDQQPEPALGIIDNFVYSTQEYALSGRESVLLYTDGLFESHDANDNMYGEERLSTSIKQHLHQDPELLMDEVLKDVYRFSGSDGFEDDVCLLAVVPAPCR
jgi:PAS domain S-box-containing protein